MSPTYCLCTGVCETGYKGDNCDQCDTGYYGDGATCTTCGTHKTTPATGTAATAEDCKFTLLSKSTITYVIWCVYSENNLFHGQIFFNGSRYVSMIQGKN